MQGAHGSNKQQYLRDTSCFKVCACVYRERNITTSNDEFDKPWVGPDEYFHLTIKEFTYF